MKSFFTALLLLITATAASAQMTLTKDEFLSIWTHSTTSTSYDATSPTGAAALLNKTGSGQTWDFSGFTYGSGQVTTSGALLPYPSGAALASDPDFSTATHVIRDTTSAGIIEYTFVRVTSDGAWFLGASRDSMGAASKVAVYSPAWQFMKFPLSLGTTWQSTSNISVAGLPPGASYSMANTYLVDGEGTFVTPPSMSHSALRVKNTLVNTIAYPPFFSQTNTNYTFNWYSKDGYSASVGADSDMVPTSVSYSAPGGTVVTTGPGLAWAPGTTGDFGNLTVGSTMTKTLTLTDTSSSNVTVESISITGTDASEFLVGSLTFPATIVSQGQLAIPVIWNPINTGGSRSATLTVTTNGNEGSNTYTINLSGMATVANEAVGETTAQSTGINIWPNPISTTGAVRFTAATEGTVAWSIIDPLGRIRATLPSVQVSAGNPTGFTLSSEELGLPSGTYYLTAHIAGNTITKAFVIAR
jgi:hypothetical protein